ncbi:energy transducer TonB [Xenorhabdus szentirmaii]|uniref:cell envelope integrity protein TolA n=1 Tax=Xenorhabdus szentirmaii TaxID=290112 RepID=UPI0032B857A4
MRNPAISESFINHVPPRSRRGLLVGILAALLLHISLIWLFNRHTPYKDTAHHLNNNTPVMGLSMTMLASSSWESWESEPGLVSPPAPLLTVIESPTKPKIQLNKAVVPEIRKEKPAEPVKPKKIKKQAGKPQEMKNKPSLQSELKSEDKPKDNNADQKTDGNDQAHSQGAMSHASTTKPLVGQGTSEIDNYTVRLRQEIERHKVYPRKAKRMKQQGTVTINFTLLENGALTAARVVNSSGNSALDDAALSAVNRASPVGTKPAGMTPEITLTLDFTLN